MLMITHPAASPYLGPRMMYTTLTSRLDKYVSGFPWPT